MVWCVVGGVLSHQILGTRHPTTYPETVYQVALYIRSESHFVSSMDTVRSSDLIQDLVTLATSSDLVLQPRVYQNIWIDFKIQTLPTVENSTYEERD